MKNTKWFGLVVSVALPLLSTNAQAPVAQGPNDPQGQSAAVPSDISPGASEAIRLAESGVGDEVVTAYIQNSQAAFNLSADHVLYLKDLGLSPAVITAMLSHDNSLRTQTQPYPPSTQPPPPQPEVPPQPEAAPPPVYVSTPPPEVNYFYNDLSPYGVWVDLAGIGWCWQPRAVVINRGWRPYCEGGHWINSDCGWFWQSDYSWGWAPFHYGRWQMHERCGWVWTPDRVWGPAWVTWRTSDDHCGWAPLPPRAVFDARLGWRFNGVSVGVNFDFGLRPDHFTFVALHDFTDRDLGHRRLAGTEVRNVYNRTTVINNYSVHNTTIINRGIPVERVAAATHTQIRTVIVRDAPKDSRAGGRTPAFDRSGTTVYRHEPTAPARATAVVAQKVDDRHPVIQHPSIARAPLQDQRSISGGSRGSSPALPSTRTQTEAPRSSQRPNVERPATYSTPQPTPRASQPSPTSRSSQPDQGPRTSQPQPTQRPTQPDQAPRSYQTTPTPARSSATARSSDEPNQSTHSPASARPDTTYSAPSRSSVRDDSRSSQTDSRGQNPHVYYPKTYRQSADVRSTPPSNPRSAAPSAPASASGNSRESQSKKGDF